MAGSSHRQRGIPDQEDIMLLEHAHQWARRAHRHASWALWCSGIGIVLAVVALLAG